MSTPTPNCSLSPVRPFVNGVPNTSARFPVIGELVLLRLPFDLPGPTSTPTSSAISTRKRSHHPCLITGVLQRVEDWEVEVYICRSFSSAPDTASYVNSLSLAERNLLLPLPHYTRSPSTPAGFGAPLSFNNNNYFSRVPTWLVAKPVSVKMGGNSPYKPFQPQALLPRAEIARIKAWFTETSVARTTLPFFPDDGDTGASAASSFVVDAFLLESPQDDDPWDDDDACSEVGYSLQDFLLVGTPKFSEQMALREMERRTIVQEWILSL